MTLPKAVADATAELAALEQQFTAPVEAPSEAPVEQTEPAIPEPEPSPEPAPEPPVAPSDVAPDSASEAKWEHKYRRLQGKYDAEVPRLHQQLREVTATLQQLQAQQAAPPPPPAPSPTKEAEPDRYVSDEDVANYGEDFVDIQKRITLDATREMRKQIADLQAQLQQTGNQMSAVSFETKLLQAIPDFPVIDASPEWIAWLNEVDPLIRGPRRVVAQAAFERGDVEAVKSYVNLWKQGQEPEPPKVNRDQELRRQVQPSRTTSSAPVSAQKTYTLQEADVLFAKMQQFASQGRIDEAKKLDAEISAAYAEGRVIA